MYLDKPEWLQGDADATAAVMAIDVHPQGGRLISCGSGITVWNLRPILDPAAAAAAAAAGPQQVPRQLAHLSDHQQAVNVVRFSHDGACFASGSDDSCIFVYELRPGKGSSSFGSGSSKPNLENWRIRSMLRSHSSNVADLDWAPGDQYLASASFDNKVLVWDLSLKHPHPVVTLEHNGMAKGVAWDPLGKYLASMGDDGLRLWDARTWRQVAHLEAPFRDSSKQNYHLRPAWTVDGTILAVPNATDPGTNRPTTLLVCRDTWEVATQSFVGHEMPVWAARASPKMFHIPAGLHEARQQGATSAAQLQDAKASLVAVCSADKGCSVWSGGLMRPLVAVQGLFARGVTDAAWTPDGANLLLASLDGSIAVCRFTEGELGRPVSEKEFAAMLKEDYGDLSADVKPLSEYADAPRPQQQQPQQAAAGPRRIAPMPAGEGMAPPPAAAAARADSGGLGMGAGAGLPPGASALDSRLMPQGAAATTTLAAPKKRSALPASGPATAADTPTKRQAVGAAGRPARAQGSHAADQAPGSSSSGRGKGPTQLLPEPAVLPKMQVSLGRAGREVMLPDGQLSMQIQNAASGPVGPMAEVKVWLDKSLMWEDLVEGQVVGAAGSPMFSAVALQGGQLLLYTQRGRRMLGALALGSTAALLCSQGLWHLLVVSTTGTLKVFNLQKIQRDSEVSLAPILTPGVTVVDMWLGGTAATHCMPLVVLSNGTGWGWHQQLKEWVQMADARRQLTPHTDPMDLRPGDTSRLLDGIRPARGDLLLQPLHDQQLLARRTRAGFEEWLATAGMLGAADSARVALGAYVRQLVLADDLSRLIEVIQDLLGPVRRQPGHPWEPTLCGLSKWELLREEVLPLMAGKPKLESNRRLVQQRLEEAELWQKQLQQESDPGKVPQQPGDKLSLSWLPRLQEKQHVAT